MRKVTTEPVFHTIKFLERSVILHRFKSENRRSVILNEILLFEYQYIINFKGTLYCIVPLNHCMFASPSSKHRSRS